MFGDNPMETDAGPLTAANSFLCRDLCSTTSGYKSYILTFKSTIFFHRLRFLELEFNG